MHMEHPVQSHHAHRHDFLSQTPHFFSSVGPRRPIPVRVEDEQASGGERRRAMARSSRMRT